MTRPGDPEFTRLAQLLYELQLANALQIRVERSKDNSETAVIGFPPTNVGPDVIAKIAEIRRILHLDRDQAGAYQVRYGGWSGKADEIAMVTRSMLQVMLELGVLAQVPEADIAGGKATPGAGSVPSPAAERPPLLNIGADRRHRPKCYVSIQYKGRWFWIAR